MSNIIAEKRTRFLPSLRGGNEEWLQRWQEAESHLINVILSEAKNL
jgi:hypothetical protein